MRPLTRGTMRGLSTNTGQRAKLGAKKSIENRYNRALKGFPTSGGRLYGRTFNKQSKMWELDGVDNDKPDKAKFIQIAAK